MWPALPWFKEPLFVRWISQLITVTVACLAAWKLPNFLAILLPPHLHMLKPLNPSPFQTELGRVAAPCAPSCADQQGLAMSLPSASLKTIPFPSTGKVQKHPDTRGPCSPATPSQEILKNHIQMHPNTKQERRNVVQLRGAKPRASVGAILNSGLVWGFFFGTWKISLVGGRGQWCIYGRTSSWLLREQELYLISRGVPGTAGIKAFLSLSSASDIITLP